MASLQDVTWLLLTDTLQGRLMRCSVTKHHRCQVEECETLRNDRPKHEHEVSSPIRKRDSVTYGIEDRGDEENLRHFVRRLNHWLPGVMQKHAIGDLVVVAPSRLLGGLRMAQDPDFKLHCELRKGEWIHLSIRELTEHPVVRELVGLD